MSTDAAIPRMRYAPFDSSTLAISHPKRWLLLAACDDCGIQPGKKKKDERPFFFDRFLRATMLRPVHRTIIETNLMSVFTSSNLRNLTRLTHKLIHVHKRKGDKNSDSYLDGEEGFRL